MNYTLHQLQVFCKVVELQSVTKASEELFLTQPAVSIQLKKLQEQFELPLIEVIGRKLHVTEFGRDIADIANRILDESKNIKLTTLNYRGIIGGKLNIAVVSTGKYVMPYFLSDFLHAHQGVDLRMDVTNRRHVINQLEENKIDFALVSVLPDNLQIETVELMENKLFLVASDNEGFTEKTKLDKVIKQHPLIYRENGSATRMAMESYFKKAQMPVGKSLQLTSNEAIKQAIIGGLGSSIMPLIGIKNALEQKDLSIVPRKDLPIVTRWHLIWLKGKRFSPTSQAFIDYLKQEKDNIIQKHFSWLDKYN